MSKTTMTNQNISRRTITRGTAWAVPALAVTAAAPAVAVSAGCTAGPVTVNLGAGTRTVLATGASGMPSKIQWTYTDTKTGVTLTVTTTAIGSTILGRRTAPGATTYLDTDLMYDEGFNIQHVTTNTQGEGETVTMAFTRAGAPVTVSNFAMRIDDIDSNATYWDDAVAINTPGVNVTPGANIDGNGASGTSANYTSGPYHNTSTSSEGANRPDDALSVKAASLNSLSLTYTNLYMHNGTKTSGGNSDQNIQLAAITFQAPAC